MELQFIAVTRDPTIRQSIEKLSSKDQWAFAFFEQPAHVMSASPERIDFLLMDEQASDGNYIPFIKKMRKLHPALQVMVIGGPKAREVREREREAGVDCYFARPIEEGELTIALKHLLEIAKVKAAAGIIGRSASMEEVVESILLVAPTEVPILIQGESGTGKDVVARAVHVMSRRREGPFEAINCASLAEGVLESELFGHEKGSFTGAVAQRRGVFERANGGTIFLDEVGEMSPNMQVRLLRVLESGEVLRVGGVKSFNVDVRVISATNRNLAEAVREGSFRQDLFYRLKGVTLYLPPLRERREDIPVLVDYFISQAGKKHGKQVKGIEAEAMRRLMDHSWPGNVRELKNLVDTLVVLSGGDRIRASSVEAQLRGEERSTPPLLPVAANKTKAEAEREMIYASILALHRDVREVLNLLRGSVDAGPLGMMKEVPANLGEEGRHIETLAQMEREAIREALRASGGNRRKAASMLGISERTLYRKIKQYGLV
jgi:DNA-binding NtrC family response regulator